MSRSYIFSIKAAYLFHNAVRRAAGIIMIKAGNIWRVGTALILLLLISGMAGANSKSAPNINMNPGQSWVEHTNDFQQDVSGEGYVMVYQDVNTNNLSLKNYMHGSGVMDMATLISSKQKPYRDNELLAVNGIPYSVYSYDSVITFEEQNEMSYAPMGFAYGNGWYADHPVNYASLLKERTDSRNFQAGISITHQIEYARAFKKDIGVQLNCTDGTNGAKGVGLNSMKIEEDVTQGTIHIGQLVFDPKLAYDTKTYGGKRSNIEPIITIDENYVGSFKVKKDINTNVVKGSYKDEADWLPCCIGGFFDMQAFEQKVNKVKTGIFDCTCRETAIKTYKPAWNGTVAQFPTAQYQKKP
jgi:hypothetical protein